MNLPLNHHGVLRNGSFFSFHRHAGLKSPQTQATSSFGVAGYDQDLPCQPWTFQRKTHVFSYLAVCQNLVPLVNIKIAGKWMFIPLKMVLIGIDPYPFLGWTWAVRWVYNPTVLFGGPLSKMHLIVLKGRGRKRSTSILPTPGKKHGLCIP